MFSDPWGFPLTVLINSYDSDSWNQQVVRPAMNTAGWFISDQWLLISSKRKSQIVEKLVQYKQQG